MLTALFNDCLSALAIRKQPVTKAYAVRICDGVHISLAYAPCVVMTPGEMNGQRLKAQLGLDTAARH